MKYFIATVLNFSLQDSNSPVMEQLTFFHDHVMVTLVIITCFVGYLMMLLLYNSFENRNFLSGQMMEMIWTILPAIVLLFIAFPSLRLLYLMDEINTPFCSIKVIGHQWYWSYELLNFQDVNFDSYMQSENQNNFRLIETDNNIILPKSLQIRVLVTAADVLHSWTVPSLGVKVDAVPGRLNQINFFMSRSGIFYGQCSEICGANHSFMPIKLESVNKNLFIKWMITV